MSLTTIAQGAINWNDFAGRIMYALQQEGKYQYLVDLSRNVLRGQIATAKKGDWQGIPPLGYDRQYFDDRGDRVRLVPHGEQFTSPDAWRCRLVPSSDTTGVELAQWIFNEYAWKETSLNGITVDMNRRAIKSPTGKFWRVCVVKKMLLNPAYAGHTVYGRNSRGKYFQVGENGSIVAPNSAPDEGVVRCENTHQAIIEAETFDAVQRKIASRRGPSRVRNNSYALSGVLACGHCGGKLYGRYDKGLDRRYYSCKSSQFGRCRSYCIPADAIEKFLIWMVCDQILSDTNLERQRADILAEAKKRKPRRSTAAKAIKGSLAKLQAKIKKGMERLLLIDDDAAQDASLLLTEWREERASLSDWTPRATAKA